MKTIGKRRIIIFIAVIGLLIFLHFVRILRPIENAVVFLFRPFTSGLYEKSSDLEEAYTSKETWQDLVNENASLKQEVNQLIAENAKLKNLEEENEILRNQLGFLTRNKYKYVLANVISQGVFFESSQENNSIVIDKGSKDGLSSGLILVDSNGIVVGKIIEVNDSMSEACLITDKDCKLAASIQNQDKTIGIAEGDLGLTVRMNYIPQTEEIKIDDTVVTSGLEEKIPRGLVIGKVIQTNKDNNEVWQNAVIEPLVDLDRLVIVSVLLP